MAKTYRGVYHNLLESEYEISNGEISLFFSSKFYMNKFLKEYKDERIEFMKRIKRIFADVPYKIDLVADIHFYKEVEKRGFRATFNGGEITWQDLHQLGFLKEMNRNIRDWFEIHKLK